MEKESGASEKTEESLRQTFHAQEILMNFQIFQGLPLMLGSSENI